MKATLTRLPAYIVRVGDTGLGAFHVVSKWEFMQKLENDKGQCLIISTALDTQHPLASSFRAMFADDKTELDAVIIGGTPDLIAMAKT